MEKFPFTAVGFLELQETLYVLPDHELKAEADAILQDFYSWIDDHFALSEQQLEFVANIDFRSLILISSNTAFAVVNRLPISLSKDDVSAPSNEPAPSDDQGKIIWPKSTLSTKSDSNGGYEATGVLVIHIDYQSV